MVLTVLGGIFLSMVLNYAIVSESLKLKQILIVVSIYELIARFIQ